MTGPMPTFNQVKTYFNYALKSNLLFSIWGSEYSATPRTHAIPADPCSVKALYVEVFFLKIYTLSFELSHSIESSLRSLSIL